MANPIFALKRTTTDALTSISAATQAVTHTANAISDVAATGAAHAHAYRTDTEVTLQQDSVRRRTRRQHELAIQDAAFYMDLESQLGNNSRLKELYQQTINEYDITPIAIPQD